MITAWSGTSWAESLWTGQPAATTPAVVRVGRDRVHERAHNEIHAENHTTTAAASTPARKP